MKQLIAIALFFSLPNGICAQSVRVTEQQPVEIFFKDTIYHLAIDSTFHRIADIQKPCNFHIEKKMKNIGDSPILLSHVFTSDPHFICEYPTEPILPGKIYSFKVCFTFSVIKGMREWREVMGFVLTTGEVINLKFQGNISSEQ